jgi:hypothetical protein
VVDRPSTYNYLMLNGEMKEIKSKEEMDSTGHMLQLRLVLFDGTNSIPSIGSKAKVTNHDKPLSKKESCEITRLQEDSQL